VRGIQDAEKFLEALKNAYFNSSADFTDTDVINMTKRKMECP